MKIYHNPRCSKSRQTLAIIREKGEEFEIVEYLNSPPNKIELKEVLKKLGMKPGQIIRKGESIYKENYKGKSYTDEEWIEIMANNPILMERPIVVKGNKAVMGRPPENVIDLF